MNHIGQAVRIALKGSPNALPRSAGKVTFAVVLAAAFAVKSSAAIIPFDVPGATNTFVVGVSPSGKYVVGRYTNALGSYGFIYDGSSYTSTNFPGTSLTVFRGVNNAGVAVGSYTNSTSVTHGFQYNSGTFTTIDVSVYGTVATGINDSGTVSGTQFDSSSQAHGYITSGVTTTQYDFLGAAFTEFSGINNLGDAVGDAANAGGMFGVLLNGTILSALSFPGANNTAAFGINSAGAIVGSYNTIAGTGVCEGATDCSGFVDTGGIFQTIRVPGASQTRASSVTDSGVVYGFYRDATTGLVRGFIDTPDSIPEPSTLAMVGLALAGMASARRRRK